VAGLAMSAASAARAREKEALLMLSSLYRLRLRLVAERARRSPAVKLATRLASIARMGRYLLGFRVPRSTVRYRTDGAGRPAYAPVSTKDPSK